MVPSAEPEEPEEKASEIKDRHQKARNTTPRPAILDLSDFLRHQNNRETEITMYIITEDGERAVNTDFITDLEVTGGSVPAETIEHPWRVVANLHYPDKIQRITLFADKRKAVALDMLKTYTTIIKRGRNITC